MPAFFQKRPSPEKVCLEGGDNLHEHARRLDAAALDAVLDNVDPNSIPEDLAIASNNVKWILNSASYGLTVSPEMVDSILREALNAFDDHSIHTTTKGVGSRG
ncbi:MAG: hypothetical protein COB66_08305 [Coxiella sp. (in: Bacteria)]|nr:MAG: hypothetical protein COB66_08305 [Coxiella sp. (in: g-proteobacteria)]